MAKKNRPTITLEQATTGHLNHTRAHHSPNTAKDYANTFKHLLEFMDGQTLLQDITEDDLQEFLHHMRETPYNTRRGIVASAQTPSAQKLKYRRPKTMQNMHTGLSALFTWATKRGYIQENPVKLLPRPRANPEPITPLTTADIKKIFRACIESDTYHNNPLVTNYRITAERDKAIIALLLECMLRASELASLRRQHITITANGGTVHVDLGKNSKSRTVPFGRTCANTLRDYLVTQPNMPADAPFFVAERPDVAGNALSRDAVYTLVKRIGQRAGVDCWPHLLRTTGACLAIRNGISPRHLQIIMGHSHITTTMRYVDAAKLDLQTAILDASPLDHLT